MVQIILEALAVVMLAAGAVAGWRVMARRYGQLIGAVAQAAETATDR